MLLQLLNLEDGYSLCEHRIEDITQLWGLFRFLFNYITNLHGKIDK